MGGKPSSLSLVADGPQKLLAGRYVRWFLEAFRRCPINHTDHSTPVFCFRQHYLQGVRGRAKDGANLRDIPKGIQQVDRICIAQHQHKHVTGGQYLRIANRNGLEFVVIPVCPDQAQSRGFVECYSKLCLRNRVDDRLVDVLGRLDEMCLT